MMAEFCLCEALIISDFVSISVPSVSVPSISVPYMSRDARKPVFGVSDQVQHKPACTVTEAS